MFLFRRATVAYILAMIAFVTPDVKAAELPAIPVGYDAYRQWDRWPYQRIGARAYMRSTYDRSGNNESADASHFLYQEREDFNVTLDIEGRGILYFARYNHWHGSPWHYEVDGRDYLVQETTTANPLKKLDNAVFLPERAFPAPLTATYATTKGADLSWVPIGFNERFRMAYSRTFYGTGYYIFHHYQPGARLSAPIASWNPSQEPPSDVLDLLSRAGTDIAPQPDTDEGRRLGVEQRTDTVILPAGTSTRIPVLRGALTIRALKLSVPRAKAVDFGHARLRITWDDRSHPSVDAPVALFFGTGTLFNRNNAEYLVKALPVNVHFTEDRVELACYFPMPFFRSARMELVNDTETSFHDIRCIIRTQPFTDRPELVGYFHATYRDHSNPQLGHDNVFLDTNDVEGGGPWSGHFVGTSFIFSDRGVLQTLEGDPRFFFDDSQTPQAYGTGTEEWGGGGDYWGGRTMTLPLVGHPVGVPRSERPKGVVLDRREEHIESAYRFLLADLMPFGRRAVIRFEHGGTNDRDEHYQSVTFWYGAPFATLELTDTLDVGDRASEAAHRYRSPDAGDAYELTSRYEWGPDKVKDVEVFPAQTKIGRTTTSVSEFTMRIRRDNLGVMLRRTLDYKYPNQRAKVFVADVNDEEPEWKPAGVWYLAGSNTCYYSYPRRAGELGKSQPVVQTSNRRFRDDEFLLPRKLTQGRDAIRIKVEFTPVERPLQPGRDVDDLAWSEIAYQAYCYVLPESRTQR